MMDDPACPRQRDRTEVGPLGRAGSLDLPGTPEDNTTFHMPSLLTRVFGSANERTLRRLWPIVAEINELEQQFQALPPEAFPEKTAEFRRRLAEEEATLDDILPEAFAAVR